MMMTPKTRKTPQILQKFQNRKLMETPMKLHSLLTLALAGSIATITAAQAGSIENMERERAVAVEQMLDPAMSAQQRWERMNYTKRRMADLERISLNDKSLQTSRKPAVLRAFKDYELSFLVHAATESQRPLMVHWLEAMGLTTSDLMNARVSR
jgi:hypothetical protein